jgi:hypothetical protein
MLRSQDIKSLEHHQRQRALQDIRFLFHGTALLVYNRKDGTIPLGKQQVSRVGGTIVRLEFIVDSGQITGNTSRPMVRKIQPQLFRPKRRAISHAQERSEQMQLVG